MITKSERAAIAELFETYLADKIPALLASLDEADALIAAARERAERAEAVLLGSIMRADALALESSEYLARAEKTEAYAKRYRESLVSIRNEAIFPRGDSLMAIESEVDDVLSAALAPTEGGGE